MRSYPLDVFLPAAGFGERLRPATNHLPKPLLPILGTPIIEGILGKLAAVCDGTIGINLHWKADLLRAWAAASPWHERIVFFPEDPILGTGGALKNAESLLSRRATGDRKSTRLNSSHDQISYAVFCLKKKKQKQQ